MTRPQRVKNGYLHGHPFLSYYFKTENEKEVWPSTDKVLDKNLYLVPERIRCPIGIPHMRGQLLHIPVGQFTGIINQKSKKGKKEKNYWNASTSKRP